MKKRLVTDIGSSGTVVRFAFKQSARWFPSLHIQGEPLKHGRYVCITDIVVSTRYTVVNDFISDLFTFNEMKHILVWLQHVDTTRTC